MQSHIWGGFANILPNAQSGTRSARRRAEIFVQMQLS